MGLYIVNRSISINMPVGTIIPVNENGSVSVDLGYGHVLVNPKYINFLVPIKEAPKPVNLDAPKPQVNLWPKPPQKLIEGLTEEQYDAKLLHSLGVCWPQDPEPISRAQEDLINKLLKEDESL